MPVGAELGPAATGTFRRLFAEGRDGLLTGRHRVESPPAEGAPRWGIGTVLRPDARAAGMIEECTKEAAAVAGGTCWLAGAAASSHLTLRAGMEPYRAEVPRADLQVARYLSALRQVTMGGRPLSFAVTGLTLTPVSVMACAAPADTTADDVAGAFCAALSNDELSAPGRTPGIWYLNLVYFTGPVTQPERLIDWVAARRSAWITDLRVSEIQVVRWRLAASGMEPVVLGSVALDAV